MFNNASQFNQNIGGWDVHSVSNMQGMFYGAPPLTSPLATGMCLRLRIWQVCSGERTRSIRTSAAGTLLMSPTWQGCSVKPRSSTRTSTVGCVQCHDFYHLFQSKDFNQPLNSWDVSSVLNMGGAFEAPCFNQDQAGGCPQPRTCSTVLQEPEFQSRHQHVGCVFGHQEAEHVRGATAFNQDVSTWDLRSVTDLDKMFEGDTLFSQTSLVGAFPI